MDDQTLKNPDGTWRYTNRLSHETSPYLLLHEHNPVDWYPWGTEALARSREEDKPIFLSVGYSTCYWCHVMERQVFCNPEIAELMNQWFINIKVDREERPDLDQVYMTATQLVTGRGGWPNSVFLTPDLEPFYAGTYFPPADTMGIPGFPKVLRALREAWTERRDQVNQQARTIADRIRNIQEGGGGSPGSPDLDRSLADGAIRDMVGRYDQTHGGFGPAPKFPPPIGLELLLREYERTRNAQLLAVVTHTLDMMAQGGMHDHLGGGFHRYSTDEKWHVPHFEKMLYDQAQLARVYLHAYAITREEPFRRAAEGIFRFVEGTLTSPEGGFYSALDAETDGVEGKCYLWSEEEIREVLGEEAELFLQVYALAPMPEEDGGVIHTPLSASGSAAALEISEDELLTRLTPLRERLLERRDRRDPPLLDTKVLTAWNGLMIEAYAYAHQVLDEPRYLEVARRAASFVLDRLTDDEGYLCRTYGEGEAKYDGYLIDYALLARGLLAIYGTTGEASYLESASGIAERMIERFEDSEGGGFFFTAGGTGLIARTKDPHDSAVPSANSVAAQVLLQLYEATGREDYLSRARITMEAFAPLLRDNPGALQSMATAVHRLVAGPDDSADALLDISQADTASRAEPGDPPPVHATVSEAPERVVPGQTFEVAVRLDIDDGWHVNANPASLDFLAPTTFELDSDLPIQVLGVDYPPGEDYRPEFTDDSIAIYRGETVIRASLKLDEAAETVDGAAIEIILSYQPCDIGRCLEPVQARLSIPVAVAR
ncbi:MAG: DUF255 domain-containing protein [Candidatus Latescibacteria bacterium]|nr:DUF255 domain-containing protein [Candidatus Latescibacterota bacterium]